MLKTIHAVGLMSGSSLDGLDMALCRFALETDSVAVKDWSLLKTDTTAFSSEWRDRLKKLPQASGLELARTHVDFGHYMGKLLQPFLRKLETPVDLIASHGHTVFHYPDQQLTLQIGDGAALAAATGHIVVDNLRALDVALGGQGAPLAPLADKHLFPGYHFYLNLGGIANISARTEDDFIAFDIGGANQVLNALAAELGREYDENGNIAAGGRLQPALLEQADALPYFQQPYPKSLGNDWVQDQLIPLYEDAEYPVADKLRTACVQLARQTARSLEQITVQKKMPAPPYRMLVTGGGALNRFLVQCIREETEKVAPLEVIIPETQIIAFKEAALIALMGALRLEGLPNCMATVTGARRDAVGGAIWELGNKKG